MQDLTLIALKRPLQCYALPKQKTDDIVPFGSYIYALYILAKIAVQFV